MAKLLSGTRIYGNTTIDTFLNVGSNVSAGNVIVGGYVQFPDGTKQYTANGGLEVRLTSSYNHANGAFDKANSANVLAQAGFDKANSANVLAQQAYNQANTGTTIGQAGFNKANSANILAQAAYDQANSANVLAQSAFNKANNGVLTVSLIDANNDVSNVVTTVTGLRFDSDAGFDVTDLGSGNVKIGMNSTFKTWKVAGQTDLVATGLDTIEFKSTNGIGITTGPLDNPKSITFDGSELYNQINTKFSSSGGAINGDVGITGNLTVVGQVVYANTQTVLIADNIITLNAAINQSASPTSNAGIAIDRGSEPNVYILYSETNDYWHYTNDGITFHKFASEGDIITLYDTSNNTSNIALAAYNKANAANVLAQAAFDAANSAGGAGGANSFGSIVANNDTVFAQQANDAITFIGDGGIQVGVDPINKRVVFSVPAGYVFNSADYGFVDEPTTTIQDYGEII